MLYFNCSLPSTRLEPAYDTAVVGFLDLSREIIFLVLFILGYFSNNCTCISRHLVKTKELNRDGLDTGEHTTLSMATVIEDEVATGHYETAVRRWRAAKEHMPTPAATLRLVLKGLLRSNSKMLLMRSLSICLFTVVILTTTLLLQQCLKPQAMKVILQ